MKSSDNAYEPPASNIEVDESKEKQAWALLAVWTTVLVIINLSLSFVVSASQLDGKSIEFFVGYVFGNVLGLPIIVFALSQIWKKHRNGRSRIKAFLYPSYFVLFSQGVSFFSLIGEIANK